mmetsp:Transcript_8473/g.14237  ORF Transcript_8473/g.14237 Transcript_8473/m.14237 type:complete len:80 (-) Transcript_8473:19-258(-)
MQNMKLNLMNQKALQQGGQSTFDANTAKEINKTIEDLEKSYKEAMDKGDFSEAKRLKEEFQKLMESPKNLTNDSRLVAA